MYGCEITSLVPDGWNLGSELYDLCSEAQILRVFVIPCGVGGVFGQNSDLAS